MGGFRVNGCGTKDYFTKMKCLGERLCPQCKKMTPFYLEKAKQKISVLYIPTITLKERYAIMCEKCGTGHFIDEAQMHQIMAGVAESAEAGKSEDTSRYCSNCGAKLIGPFCSICGTKYESETDVKKDDISIVRSNDINQDKGIDIGSKVSEKLPDDVFEKKNGIWECELCGTSNDSSATRCSLCGFERKNKEDKIK